MGDEIAAFADKVYVPKDALAPVPERLTDLGNAKRLGARHGKDLRYCFKWGKWLIWDGRRWIKDENGAIDRRAKDTVSNIYREAADSDDEKLRRAISGHANKSESEYRIKAMISLAKSQIEIPVDVSDLDKDIFLLNCENGTIDLRTGQLRDHRREDFITKLVPVTYDEKAECPLWAAFLNRIFDSNANLIKFLKKAIGYSLTGSTGERVIFIFHGAGDNGKTTFVSAIEEMLGDYALSTPTETLLHKKTDAISNDVARLNGARFVAAAESDAGKRLNEGLIKRLAGGKESITARFLHQEFFEFQPTFKIFLATNHKPSIKGRDNAIWNRIRLIPFGVTIPKEEQDQDLPNKLRAEFPGILRWAVEGALLWQTEKLGLPSEVSEATKCYREESDDMRDFIEDRITVLGGHKTPAPAVWRAYQEWCVKKHMGADERSSRGELIEYLESLGFHREREKSGEHKGRFFWVGFGLKAEASAYEPE